MMNRIKQWGYWSLLFIALALPTGIAHADDSDVLPADEPAIVSDGGMDDKEDATMPTEASTTPENASTEATAPADNAAEAPQPSAVLQPETLSVVAAPQEAPTQEALLEGIEQEHQRLFVDGAAAAKELPTTELLDRYNNLRTRSEAALQGKVKDQKKLQALLKEMQDFRLPRALSEAEQNLVRAYYDAQREMGYLSAKDPSAQSLIDDFKSLEGRIKALADPMQDADAQGVAEARKQIDDLAARLQEAMRQGKIKRTYTADGKPEIRLFMQDAYGRPQKLLDEATYYLPQDTPLSLLAQIADDGTSPIRIRLRGVNENVAGFKVGSVYFEGNSYPLQAVEAGVWEAELPHGQGVSEIRTLRFDGLQGAFHEGFTLRLEAGDEAIDKTFLITKSGYNDKVDVSGIPNANLDGGVKIPEIDAGPVGQDGTVGKEKAKEQKVIYALTENNLWLDEVLKPGTPDAPALDHVRLAIDLPKDGDLLAQFKAQNIPYHLEDGRVVLELTADQMKKNLDVDEEGNFLVDGKALEHLVLKDAVLKVGDRYVYVDSQGRINQQGVKEVCDRALEGTNYVFDAGKLYAVKDGERTLVATLDKDHFVTAEGKTLAWDADKKALVDEAEGLPTKVEVSDTGIVFYTDAYTVSEGIAFNDGDVASDVRYVAPGRHILINRDGVDEAYYAGTLFAQDGIVILHNGVPVAGDGLTTKEEVVVADGGQVVELTYAPEDVWEDPASHRRFVVQDGKVYEIIRHAVLDGDRYLADYRYHNNSDSNRLVIDETGAVLPYTARLNGDGKWEIVRKDANGEETVRLEGDNLRLTTDEALALGGADRVVDADALERVEGPYFNNGTRYEAVPQDGTVVNGRYYLGRIGLALKEAVCRLTTKDGEGNTVDLSEKTVYTGSLTPEAYYKAADGTIVYKDPNANLFFDQTGALRYSDKDRAIVRQNMGDHDVTYVDTSITRLLKQASFKLGFAGFHAGPSYRYTLNADVTATYKDPQSNQSVSIFKDGDVKNVRRVFTLKRPVYGSQTFTKEAPKALAQVDNKPMHYALFNLLFRGEDDRGRDVLLKRLFTAGDLSKEEQALLATFQEEYQRIYHKKLAWQDDNLVALGDDDQAQAVERNLVWRLVFASDDAVYPEDDAKNIVLDDVSLDNRLIYESIVINDTKENVQALKKEQGDDFKGDTARFSIDEVKAIYLGVNPYYKKGDLVAVKGFKITREEILQALAGGDEGTIQKEGVNIAVERNKENGTLHIFIKDAFYDQDGKSTVQKVFEKERKAMEDEIAKADSLEALRKVITDHYKDTPCEKELLAGLKRLEETKRTEEDGTETPVTFDDIKARVLQSVQAMRIEVFKDENQDKDHRFDGVRILFERGTHIGGTEAARRYVDITTVIAPKVDIPYTDAFGNVLTNETMYLERARRQLLLTNETYQKAWKDKVALQGNSSEKVWDKAYATLSESLWRQLTKDAMALVPQEKVKTLATGDRLTDEAGKAVYAPIQGNQLANEDLSVPTDWAKQDAFAPMKESDAFDAVLVNPYYMETAEGKIVSAGDLGLTGYYAKRPITLIGYYLHRAGEGRDYFANSASYDLYGDASIPTLFEDKDGWKKKNCFDGVLGHCLEDAGNSLDKDQDYNPIDAPEADLKGNRVRISYDKTPRVPDEEKPKVEKEGTKTVVYVDGKEADARNIDFTVRVTIDHKTKDAFVEDYMVDHGVGRAEATEALQDKLSSYNERGYMEVKDAFVIDLLPDGLDATNLAASLDVDEEALKVDGANENLDMEAFKKGVRILYIEDILNYAQSVEGDAGKRLQTLLDEAGVGANQAAVIAWLPTFEGPHGTTNQFTLTLKGLAVREDALQNMKENVAHFVSKPYQGHDTHKYRVTRNEKEGHVDKYLQLYDENGNVIEDADKNTWFQGKATLHFGDNFDYKLHFHIDSTSDTSGIGGFVSDWFAFDLTDALPYPGDAKGNSLRPVLRDKVVAPEGFDVLYLDKDGNTLNPEDSTFALRDVYSVRLSLKAGERFNPSQGVELVLPMEIPTFDVRIEDGKAVYENGDLFDLDALKAGKVEATNQLEGRYPSNPVTIEVKNDDSLRVIKVWEKDGKPVEGEALKELPAIQVDVYRTDEKGERVKIATLELSAENGYEVSLKNLPREKVEKRFKADDSVEEETIYRYTYSVEEVAVDGWKSEVLDRDAVGFVRVIKNTEKPNHPTPPSPNHPNEPGNPPPDRPNEPGNPPPDHPNEPGNPPPDHPNEPGNPPPDQPNKPNTPPPTTPEVPKTGRSALPYLLFAGALFAFGVRRRWEV